MTTEVALSPLFCSCGHAERLHDDDTDGQHGPCRVVVCGCEAFRKFVPRPTTVRMDPPSRPAPTPAPRVEQIPTTPAPVDKPRTLELIQCDTCRAPFASKAALGSHRRYKHPEPVVEVELPAPAPVAPDEPAAAVTVQMVAGQTYRLVVSVDLAGEARPGRSNSVSIDAYGNRAEIAHWLRAVADLFAQPGGKASA